MVLFFLQERTLPSREEMIRTAEEDMAEWTTRFKSDALRVKGDPSSFSSSSHIYYNHPSPPHMQYEEGN